MEVVEGDDVDSVALSKVDLVALDVAKDELLDWVALDSVIVDSVTVVSIVLVPLTEERVELDLLKLDSVVNSVID